MKVKIDTSRVTEKIKKAFDDLITRGQVYIDIANFSKERIQNYARLQKRMEQDGADKLPTAKLSPGYVKKRKELSAGQDGTDPNFFLPNVITSQLTFTGQLLKSLQAKVLRGGKSRGKVELEFKGNRKEGGSNKAVYNKLVSRDSGYEVLALSKKAIERIRTIVLTRLRKELVAKKLK